MKVKVDYIESSCCTGRYREEWFEEFETVAELVASMKEFEDRFPDAEVWFDSDCTLTISREL